MRQRSRSYIAIVSVITLLALVTALQAEGRFDSEGRETFRLPGTITSVGGLRSGSMIIGTTSLKKGAQLMRLRPNGGVDPSFGEGGFASIGNGGPYALQGDGSVIFTTSAKGSDGWNPVVGRLLPNGRPDRAFGNDGRVVVDLGGSSNDAVTAIGIGQHGAIVLGGYRATAPDSQGAVTYVATVTRLRGNGSVDRIFGDNGTASLSAIPGATGIATLDVALDGSIVAGVSGMEAEGWEQLVRIRPNGALDTGFAGDGALELRELAAESIHSVGDVVTLSDGRIVVVGGLSSVTGNKQDRYQALVARLSRTGTPDRSFGRDGLVRTGFPGGDFFADGVAVQPSGEVIVVGSAQLPSSYGSDLAAVALTGRGRLDGRFGRGGRARFDFSDYDFGEGVVFQPHRRVVLIGTSLHPGKNGGSSRVAALARVDLRRR